MSNRTIKHEIKLQKSVIVILAFLAIGVCANAFAPAFSVNAAKAVDVRPAGFHGLGSIYSPVYIECVRGCYKGGLF